MTQAHHHKRHGAPSKKIARVITSLRINGDEGTANAIQDAVDFMHNARRMLNDSIRTFHRTDYYAEEQAAQARIDILLDLFEFKK